MEALLLWAGLLSAAILVGFAVGFIRAPLPRRLGLSVSFVLPPLLVFGFGLSNGCALGQGGQECFGYGFGLVFSLGMLPVWIAPVMAGTWLTRRLQTRR